MVMFYESDSDQEGNGDGVRRLSQEEYEQRVCEGGFVRELLVEHFEEFKREVIDSREIELGGLELEILKWERERELEALIRKGDKEKRLIVERKKARRGEYYGLANGL